MNLSEVDGNIIIIKSMVNEKFEVPIREMDARSHQTIMSYSNNGFVEQEPVLYPPGAYGSGTPSLAPTVCDRRIMDPIEMEMNEMSFVGSTATSAGYMGLDRRRMNARN